MDSPKEDQGVADGELVVQRQVLQGGDITTVSTVGRPGTQAARSAMLVALGFHLGHVSNHLPRDLVSGERRRLPQHGDVAPRDFQSSHDAFQQGGLPAPAGPQQAVAATHIGERLWRGEKREVR